MIALHNRSSRLAIDPARGGGVVAFDVGETAAFLPARDSDTSPLGLANFALLPFCNRIAGGRFEWLGEEYRVPMNCLSASARHPLHGHGWLNAWKVATETPDTVELRYSYAGRDWSSAYEARQIYRLEKGAYTHELQITNVGPDPMPAGLGLHPYSPADAEALDFEVSEVWPTGDDELPQSPQPLSGPVELRSQDCAYRRGGGDILLCYRDHAIRLTPHPDLPFVHLYVPPDLAFVCVEPVSDVADAINRNEMRVLEPGEDWAVSVRFAVEPLG